MMPRAIKVLLAAGFFVALAGASAYLTLMAIVKGEKTVVVPDLTGGDVVFALQRLSDLRLDTKVTGVEFHDTIAPHHVIFQKPEPGSEIKQGRDVRLIISKGPQRAVVPRLAGIGLDNARAVLDSNGLCLGQVSSWHTDQATGLVTAQEPPPGSSILKKDCVNLLVSLGPPNRGIVMPALIGLPVEESIVIAERARLSVTDIHGGYRPDLPDGWVLDQSPPDGHRGTPGTAVTLVVNRRHPNRPAGEALRSGFIRHRLAPGFLRQHVRLQVVGAGLAVDLFNEYVAPGTELWFMVPVTGNTAATLHVDGEPVRTRLF